MRSLKRIFNKIRSENPYWSDYTCFAEAVRGRKFSKKTIIRNFNSLVDKEDYEKNEKKEIIEHLMELSKCG
jgi:predicted Ser/Thr protein kinase